MPAFEQGFALSHARDAAWESGLRGFFAYRDLGVAAATEGRVGAHVIRARGASDETGDRHRHALDFQLEAGSSVVQPPGIRHVELAHSADLEMLEITLPARFETESDT
jgi:hypothetical protein